jgi:hypothetical protein
MQQCTDLSGGGGKRQQDTVDDEEAEDDYPSHNVSEDQTFTTARTSDDDQA